MLSCISHCVFAESPFLQIVEHVFIFSVVLDFPFSTMVHRTIKLAMYHVYKSVKTYFQDARLGSSHQEIALKKKIQIPYRNLEMSRPSLAGNTRTNKLPPRNSQLPRQPSREHTRHQRRQEGMGLVHRMLMTSQLLSSVLESARIPGCFSIYMYPSGEENVFEQNNWLSQNCLAPFQHHT